VQDLTLTRHPTAPHTAVVTLDRPEARNAYSVAMIDSLVRALDQLADVVDGLQEVAALLGDQGGVGGDARQDAPGVDLADVVDVGGVEEELHGDLRGRS